MIEHRVCGQGALLESYRVPPCMCSACRLDSNPRCRIFGQHLGACHNLHLNSYTALDLSSCTPYYSMSFPAALCFYSYYRVTFCKDRTLVLFAHRQRLPTTDHSHSPSGVGGRRRDGCAIYSISLGRSLISIAKIRSLEPQRSQRPPSFGFGAL